MIENGPTIRADAAGGACQCRLLGDKVMTGNGKKPNDPASDPRPSEDEGGPSEAETFANIEPDGAENFANIEPDKE
jgi:hypothetical protein